MSNKSKKCNVSNNLKKAKNNFFEKREDPSEKNRFYDRIISLGIDCSDFIFPRKKPQVDYSVYKTEEEYEESLSSAIAFSKNFTKKKKESFDTIIYHKNADGIMGAYIAWKYLTNDGKKNKEIKLITSVPDKSRSGISNNIKKIEHYITGNNVIMIDLSYNLETIEYINSISKFFVYIDNHKNDSIIDLKYAYTSDTISVKGKPKQSHGACANVWKFFYPKENVPYIIQSIDANDVKLYIKYLPEPSAIATSFDVLFAKNQKKYNQHLLMKDIHSFLSTRTNIQSLNFINVLGHIMERYGENMKNEIAKKAQLARFTTKSKEYKVYVLNYAQPGLLKRVAKNIADTQKNNCDFVVVWYYDYNKRQFEINLTSTHIQGIIKPDVRKIASEFGGYGEGDSARFSLRGNLGELDKYIKPYNKF